MTTRLARTFCLRAPVIKEVHTEVYQLGIDVGINVLLKALRGDSQNGLPAYDGPVPLELTAYLHTVEQEVGPPDD